MKRTIAFILTIALLLSAACIPALAEESKSSKWPVVELKGSETILNALEIDRDFRQQSYSGPGKQYNPCGAFLARKVVSVKAVHKENGFVLAEVDNRSGKRYVYFEEKDIQAGDVETVSWTPVPARTLTTIHPFYFGPGKQYDKVTQRTKSKYLDYTLEELMWIFDGDMDKIEKALEDTFPTVSLEADSPVKVLFETDGWLLCEFDCTVAGLTRGWLPADQVAAE